MSRFDPGALQPSVVVLSILVGWGIYLFVTSQPIGRPRPDLGERLRRLDVRERVRMRELGRFQKQPIFRNPLMEALLRPIVDGAGRTMSTLISRFSGGTGELERKLAVAQPGLDVAGYYGQQVLTGLVFVLLLGSLNVMLIRLTDSTVDVLPVWVWLILFVTGFLIPKLTMESRLRKRRRAILMELPAVLEMLTIAMSAGRTPEEALVFVSAESEGEMAREFGYLSRELAMTCVTLPDALYSMARRTGVPELSQLAAQVKATDDLGVSIINALSVQAETLRERKRLEIVEAGNRASIKMVMIIALFIFPSMFVVLLLPATLRVLGLAD
ncbi:MAG: type II secretion system F family protein [Chloroflexota bacterium]|nr:type II secretion system F family protein [Chloroflexota bacterium]